MWLCTASHIQVLFPNTVDLDICNCSFVLLDQIVERIGPKFPMPDDARDALRRCAERRDQALPCA